VPLIRHGQRVFVRDLGMTGRVREILDADDGSDRVLVVRLDRKVRRRRWAHVAWENAEPIGTA
jgi:hypothetical protein